MERAGYIVVAALIAAGVAVAARSDAQRAPWSGAGDPDRGTFVIPIARAYDDASPPVPAPTGPLLGLITRYDDPALGADGVLLLPTFFIARDEGATLVGPGGLLALYRDYDGEATSPTIGRLASGLPVARSYDDDGPGPPVFVLPELTIEAVDRDARPHVLLPAVHVTR